MVMMSEGGRFKRRRVDDEASNQMREVIQKCEALQARILVLERDNAKLIETVKEKADYETMLEQDNTSLQEEVLENRSEIKELRDDRNSLVWYKEKYEWISCTQIDACKAHALLSLSQHLAHLQSKVFLKLSQVREEEEKAVQKAVREHGNALIAHSAMDGCIVCMDDTMMADHVFCPCSHYLCKTCADKMKSKGEKVQCPLCRNGSSQIMQLRGLANVSIIH